MRKPLLLGIDAGTSVVKTVVFDEDGREIAVSRERVPVETTRPNWAEQDMDLVWSAVKKTVSRCLKGHGISASDIAGVGVAGQGDGCRLVDSHLRPVRKAVLWTDGRAGEIVRRWEQDGSALSSFHICGSAIFSGAPAAVLEWLRRNEPDSLARAAHFLFAKDWIKLKLTGRIITDPSDASRAPFDIRKRGYSPDLFEMLGLSSYFRLFPEISEASEVIGEVTREAARETGLRVGTPVTNGMIDVVACGVGVGAINHGQAYSIIGTTCFNGVIMDRVELKPVGVGMTLAYAFDEQTLRSMPSLAGTPNLDWFIDRFCPQEKEKAAKEKLDLYALLEDEVSRVPVGCEGIIYHPYINPGGERAPFVKPSAVAQFFGLSLRHSRWHLLRSVYEGVALSMVDCFDHIPVSVSNLMVCGGGAESPLWCQIVSDATGRAVSIPKGSEFGALGVSITTGLATGVYRDKGEAVKRTVSVGATFEPNMENHRKYQELSRLYRSLYRHVWDDWDLRAEILGRVTSGTRP
ncbi:MAG: carbohydrate kinase [Deltaproteobacteria bacterium]|nr:carbohydrate kinase [Deltaproteobacteria bacterium]